MKLRIYRIHQAFSGMLLVAQLIAAGDYFFDFGLFGSKSKAVAVIVLAIIVVYAGWFFPTRKELEEYPEAKRAAKERRHGNIRS